MGDRGSPTSGPVRTCVGCRRRVEVATGRLVRLAATPEGTVAVGRTLPGRGAWLCRGSVHCFDQALRRRSLHRALRIAEIPPTTTSSLRETFDHDFPGSDPAVRH